MIWWDFNQLAIAESFHAKKSAEKLRLELLAVLCI